MFVGDLLGGDFDNALVDVPRSGAGVRKEKRERFAEGDVFHLQRDGSVFGDACYLQCVPVDVHVDAGGVTQIVEGVAERSFVEIEIGDRAVEYRRSGFDVRRRLQRGFREGQSVRDAENSEG